MKILVLFFGLFGFLIWFFWFEEIGVFLGLVCGFFRGIGFFLGWLEWIIVVMDILGGLIILDIGFFCLVIDWDVDVSIVDLLFFWFIFECFVVDEVFEDGVL